MGGDEIIIRKSLLYASVIIVVLLLFLLLFFFFAFLKIIKDNRKLSDLIDKRSVFFRNITHEFRTPITVILGLNSELKTADSLSSKESKSFMDAIERQGQQMLKLVNQLLNMSKINASKDLIRWEKGNIIPYLEMVIDSISIYAKKKEQSITFTSNQPEITMNFVPEYFQNILQNLLSNAIKFSPSNSIIRVSVKLDKEQFILEVADQGIGISKEHQKKLFDLFYQVSKSDSNNGTGIGLSYTKQLVEAMKGNIEVESEVNAGSVFKVTIPIQNSEPEKITVVDKSNTDSPDLFKKALQHIIMPKEISEDNSNTKILLIEDNRDVVLYLRSMLENRYEVVVEEDGVKGLDVAHNMIPDIIISDIIISDIVMPNKDGLSLCKDIRDSALLS